jgi:hypothetical protein
MWRRLGEVCEALAGAEGDALLALWRELSEVLEPACRAAVEAGAEAQPTLARCVEVLADEGLPERLTPFVEQVRRWEHQDAEWLVWDVRGDIEGAIVASLALRCAAGEPLGPELLLWASRCWDSTDRPVSGDIIPTHTERPVSWIEACIPPLWQANQWRVKSMGADRLRMNIRYSLCPALQHVQQHDLDELLRGANPSAVSGLRSLLHHRPFMDLRDLGAVLSGEGEIRFDKYGCCLLPAECVNSLVRLIRSEDVRVRLVTVIVTGDYLDCFEPCEDDDPSDPRPPMPADMPDALNAARSDTHPVVAALATCAAGQLNHPAVPLASVVELLWDARPAVRAAAVRAFAFMQGGAGCADAIAPLLADPAASVRLAAAEAVERLAGPALSPAVRTCLLPLLDDADVEVRQQAIWAAAALGPAMTEAMIVRLTAMTAEEGVFIRTYSIQALAAAGPLARRPSVLAALLACFEEPNVFEHAWEAYADLAGPTDPELLRRVTAERDQTTSKWRRQTAIEFLARIGAS